MINNDIFKKTDYLKELQNNIIEGRNSLFISGIVGS